ncbi:hypothetical protein ACS3UN_11020 [Oscillospiraceae bacterium LTW-04]|nr:hypothetical protein RBH76_12765 [Oscillospiraceae bacterium MB24-C1]
MKRTNSKRPRRSPAQRRRIATIIGGAFVAFAAVGLFSAMLWGADVIGGLFDNSAKRARYESFISPVVMMDPVPFSRVENVEQNLLLQSSLWAALMGENRGAYTYDENGLLLVPSSDVDVAATKLFGPNVVLTHQSFEDYDASYLFDPEISAYRVPSINKVAYSPAITDIDKKGDTISLTVGYVAPGNIWSTDPQTGEDSDQPTPEKYMLYTLTKWDQGYYISAVGDVDTGEQPRS